MAHFAEIDDNGIVLRVLVVSNDDAPDPAPEISEPLGRKFLASLGIEGNWVQTSFNSNFRKKYGWVGDTYDAKNDVFISPQPYPSWVLDENFDWQPPFPCPTDGKAYEWEESSLSWKEIPTTS